MSQFTKQAIAAGFTPEQAAFMDVALAKFPHTHDMEEIEGLDEALEALEGDGDDEDED